MYLRVYDSYMIVHGGVLHRPSHGIPFAHLRQWKEDCAQDEEVPAEGKVGGRPTGIGVFQKLPPTTICTWTIEKIWHKPLIWESGFWSWKARIGWWKCSSKTHSLKNGMRCVSQCLCEYTFMSIHHSSYVNCPECWARTRSDHLAALAFSLLTTKSNIQDAISSTKCECVLAHVPKKPPASSDQSLPHEKVVNSRDVTNSQSD